MQTIAMAEINTAAPDQASRGRRRKRLSTKVDLTPMVDLGFLLITFFIFNTKLSEPKEMRLVMPKESRDSIPIGKSTALTVFPLSNGKVFYYHGELDEALKTAAYGFTNYLHSGGVGEVIRNKQQALYRLKKNRKDLFFLIKPTPQSNYQQIMHMLDEVIINDLSHYAITELTDKEKQVLIRLNGSL